MAARISVQDYLACGLNGSALSPQSQQVHPQAGAKAAARISLDPDRLALAKSLHHFAKAYAANGTIHIKPCALVLPEKVKGKVAKTSLARGMDLQHCSITVLTSFGRLDRPLCSYALGDIDSNHGNENSHYRRYGQILH